MTGSGGRANEASKRITRAIEAARKAVTEPELSDIYLRRFHRAMDALSDDEGHEVYKRCRREGWYQLAAESLKRVAS